MGSFKRVLSNFLGTFIPAALWRALAGGLWLLQERFGSYRPADAQEAAELKMANDLRETCVDWSVKTASGRFIDGPDIAKLCKDYFAHRSDARAREDDCEVALRVLGGNGRGHAQKHVK